jgi:uncharacterized iron-regulated membrane protein
MAAKKSLFRRINDWFHLWVGIASGIPVILISFTGCLLVFEQEIKHNLIYGSWWHITTPADEKPLPPSALYQAVKTQIPLLEFHRFWYYGDKEPVKITPDNSDSLVFVHPYTGRVLAQVDHEDLFAFIQDGHTELWMPRKIGMQVVKWSTAVFFFLLITGLILWIPKKWNKKTIKDSFTIKWDAKRKRINYDLHNVLGFYALLLSIVISFTGLIMSFPFLYNGIQKLAGGKPRSKDEKVITLETLPENTNPLHQRVDLVWEKVRTKYALQNTTAIIINIPQKPDESIYTCTDMYNGSWRSIYFDQHSLAILSSSETSLKDAPAANWIRRSNYALHVGAIGGTTTKIFYFLASLICATLPVTGFYIWWGKKKKQRK